jgi:hypothetical protein
MNKGFRNNTHRLKTTRWVLATIICCLWLTAVSAAEFRAIRDFHDVAAAVTRYADQVGPEHVLLAVDIDNTLLAMNESLGSEQWFDWQVYLLENEPNSPQLVARTFDDLLNVQGRLFDLGRMHPTQRDLPSILLDIQNRGVAAIVLTSRGSEFRASTERELERCGFRFTQSSLSVRGMTDATYLPFDRAHPADSGLTSAEIETLALDVPRPISYSNGIMMSAGQNKGVMLVTLLHRAERNIKAVVFVDNRADHVAGVFSQLIQRGIDVTALVYQREDDAIRAFNFGSKHDVTCRWKQLSHAPTNSVSGKWDGPKLRCKSPRRMSIRR